MQWSSPPRWWAACWSGAPRLFVGALAAVPFGWLAARLLTRLRQARGAAGKIAIAVTGVLVLMPGFPSSVAAGLPDRQQIETGGVSKISASSCKLQSHAPALSRLPTGTIFAPLDIGPALLEATPHNVVATAHHRAAPAMHDVILAFTSPADRARQIIASHSADYVALCADLPEPGLYADRAPAGLAADLMKGRVPGWLEPVEFGAPPDFRVWRVRRVDR